MSDEKTQFRRDAQFTELVARRLWPRVRPLFRKKLGERCTRCILPAPTAELKGGFCQYCRGVEEDLKLETEVEGAAEWLDERLKALAGTGKDKDAIVLFSGGKDSAYMLHRLRTEYPDLRLMTMMVDNGFMSPFALENARHILEKLPCDHLTMHPNKAFVNKVFRHVLTNLDKQVGYSIVDLTDGFITFDTARNYAAQAGIPAIICGLSPGQVAQQFPLQPSLDSSETVGKHIPVDMAEVLTEQEMLHWWDPKRFTKKKRPEFLMPYVAWNIGEEEVLAEVSRLGLIDEKRTSPLLTNNTLIPLIGIAEVARFGHSSFEVEFARNIRQGMSTDAYWRNIFEMLQLAAKTGAFLGNTTKETMARLELQPEDLGLG